MMKRPFSIVSLLFLSLFVACDGSNAQTNAAPLLILNGYEGTGTNRQAVLELHNPTSLAMWLCYSGSEPPLSAPFVERAAVPPAQTNSPATDRPNIYSLRVGSFFMRGERVDPGHKLLLFVPVVSGQPAKHVGLYYYLGTYKDGNDFLSNLGTPLLDKSATSDERTQFYREKAKRSLRAPQRREVWCSEPVFYRAGVSNDVPVREPNPR